MLGSLESCVPLFCTKVEKKNSVESPRSADTEAPGLTNLCGHTLGHSLREKSTKSNNLF